MAGEYTIEVVEQKTLDLKGKVLGISFQLCDRMEEYKTLPDDKKPEHDKVTKQLEEEQKSLEKQFKTFSNILNQMRKVENVKDKGGLGSILANMQDIKLGISQIQQKIEK